MEADGVGELRGVERSSFERVAEAVDIDEETALLHLREQIAELSAHRLDPFDRPFASADCREREAFRVRGRELRACKTQCATLPAVPGLGAAAADRLARGSNKQGRVCGKPRGVEAGGFAGEARAASQRGCGGGGAERTQKRPPRCERC